MQRHIPPFRADHVGSLLRPAELKQARTRHESGEIGAEELRAVEDRTIEALIAKQAEVGLRSATDGELRRSMWHFDFLEYDTERAGGFEPLRLVPKAKTVVLGLVTSKTGELESKDSIKRRINDAGHYLDLDQLCLALSAVSRAPKKATSSLRTSSGPSSLELLRLRPRSGDSLRREHCRMHPTL